MPSAHEPVDLFAVPVAGVGEHHCGCIGDTGGGQFARGRASIIGPSWPKSAELIEISAAMTICCSLQTAWAL